jgi:hypothetical protein
MVRNTGMRKLSAQCKMINFSAKHEYTVSDDSDVFITIDAYADCSTPEPRTQVKSVVSDGDKISFCHWPKLAFR